MVGLLDVAPSGETVIIRGHPVPVQGVSARGVAVLIGRFPELRAMIAGREIDPKSIMTMGADIVAAILAAGTGSPGDAAAERVADSLSISEQADLIDAILRLTMPAGVGPFVERLTALGGRLGLDVVTPAPEIPATI